MNFHIFFSTIWAINFPHSFSQFQKEKCSDHTSSEVARFVRSDGVMPFHEKKTILYSESMHLTKRRNGFYRASGERRQFSNGNWRQSREARESPFWKALEIHQIMLL